MTLQINGNVHLVLVVKDAGLSAEWYCRVMGFMTMRERVEVILSDRTGRDTTFLSTVLFHLPTRFFLGLAQPQEVVAGEFDWRRIGLQHIGFHVADRSDLDEWSQHLDDFGIEHSTVIPEGPGLLVRFHDPDDIPIEVFWPDWERCTQLWAGVARSRAMQARERRRSKSV